MGNRAVITDEKKNIGIYLHWHGGYDSISAFLKYCELQEFRSFDVDEEYAFARLVQVIANFMGPDGLSVGVSDSVKEPWDNGVYVVKGWKIEEHYMGSKLINPDDEYHEGYDLFEMLKFIDARQPKEMQMGEALSQDLVPRNEIQVGDIVFIKDCLKRGKDFSCWRSLEVLGVGKEGQIIDGMDVSGIPFISLWNEPKEKASQERGNYLRNKKYFCKRSKNYAY